MSLVSEIRGPVESMEDSIKNRFLGHIAKKALTSVEHKRAVE